MTDPARPERPAHLAFPALVGFVAEVTGAWHPCEAPYSATVRLRSTPATDDDAAVTREVPRNAVGQVRELATSATWRGAPVRVQGHQRAGVVLRMDRAPDGAPARRSATGGWIAVVDPAELTDVVTRARLVHRHRPRWARADAEDPSLLVSGLHAEVGGRLLLADEPVEGLVPVGRDPLADVPVAQTLLGFAEVDRFVRVTTTAVLDGAPVRVTGASGATALVMTADGVERSVPLAVLSDVVEEVRPATVAPPPAHRPPGLLPPPRLGVRPDPSIAAWVERTGPEHRYLRHLVVAMHNALLSWPDERARLAELLAAADAAGRLDPAHDVARAVLHLDWAVRTAAPTWLDLAGFPDAAAALRASAPVTDAASAERVRDLLRPRGFAEAVRSARLSRPAGFRIENVAMDLGLRGLSTVVIDAPLGDPKAPAGGVPYLPAALGVLVRECTEIAVHRWYADLVAESVDAGRPLPDRDALDAVVRDRAGAALGELRRSSIDLVRRALAPCPHL